MLIVVAMIWAIFYFQRGWVWHRLVVVYWYLVALFVWKIFIFIKNWFSILILAFLIHALNNLLAKIKFIFTFLTVRLSLVVLRWTFFLYFFQAFNVFNYFWFQFEVIQFHSIAVTLCTFFLAKWNFPNYALFTLFKIFYKIWRLRFVAVTFGFSIIFISCILRLISKKTLSAAAFSFCWFRILRWQILLADFWIWRGIWITLFILRGYWAEYTLFKFSLFIFLSHFLTTFCKALLDINLQIWINQIIFIYQRREKMISRKYFQIVVFTIKLIILVKNLFLYFLLKLISCT